MSAIECPKCKGTRFQPVKPVWEYRRNWLGVVERYRLADRSGCEGCGVVWEIGRNGSMVQVSDAPVTPASRPADERDRERREVIPERVERARV